MYICMRMDKIASFKIIATFADKLNTHEKHSIHTTFTLGFHRLQRP